MSGTNMSLHSGKPCTRSTCALAPTAGPAKRHWKLRLLAATRAHVVPSEQAFDALGGMRGRDGAVQIAEVCQAVARGAAEIIGTRNT